MRKPTRMYSRPASVACGSIFSNRMTASGVENRAQRALTFRNSPSHADTTQGKLIRVLNIGPAGEQHSAKAEHHSCNDLQRYKAHKDSGLIATKTQTRLRYAQVQPFGPVNS